MVNYLHIEMCTTVFVDIKTTNTEIKLCLPGEKDAQTAIGCWRGRTNMSLLIPKEEALQLLRRLFDVGKDNAQSLKEESVASTIVKDVVVSEDIMDPLSAPTEQEDADASMSVAEELPLCEDARAQDDI